MEGSGSGSGSVSKNTGIGGTSSSLSDLFDGWGAKNSGGLFGVGADSSKPGFAKGPEEMGRESINREWTGKQRSPIEGHSVGGPARNVNGNNPQKGQSLHSKSQNLNDTFLGSSLHYGGRDLCCDPSTTKTEGLHGLKKDNQEDDTNTSKASRGNWWQGSLYY